MREHSEMGFLAHVTIPLQTKTRSRRRVEGSAESSSGSALAGAAQKMGEPGFDALPGRPRTAGSSEPLPACRRNEPMRPSAPMTSPAQDTRLP
eukprot:scaffold220951_cov32-Tisochrysis_lutea.AAC.2